MEGMMMAGEMVTTLLEEPKFRDPPETNELVKKWQKKVEGARKFWKPFYDRCEHSRNVVSGMDWSRDPKDKNFYLWLSNLINSTINTILPSVYARNPEISVTTKQASPQQDIKLLSKTIQMVTNREMTDAGLKVRAKATVRAALTCNYGVLKVMYQSPEDGPIIQQGIQDAQDNIKRVQGLLASLNEDEYRADQELYLEELEQTLAALYEKKEAMQGEGLVIDRVLTEYLVIDPSVKEFDDYVNADWMAQLIPMDKETAESEFGYKLDKAKTFKGKLDKLREGAERMPVQQSTEGDDEQVLVIEIWDRKNHRIYTMVEGCEFWVKEPYSPEQVGARWYPFFLLPYQVVDGRFVGPSIVDLTERLQHAHNDNQEKWLAHKELIKPGYISSADIDEKTIRRFSDSEMGEITILDAEGQPINQVMMPRAYPPMDPMLYDTSPIRVDWEQVTGLQDATRSSIVEPKTATEAQIMQQSLSTRISEFRDKIEDYLKEIAEYSAQILLLNMNEDRVVRIMGPHKMGPLDGVTDPITGEPVIGVVEASYDWPVMTRDRVFDLIELQIRAGSTGAPDEMQQREVWNQTAPAVQNLIMQIRSLIVQGMDASPEIALLRMTVERSDDRIEVDTLIPKLTDEQRAMIQMQRQMAAAQG